MYAMKDFQAAESMYLHHTDTDQGHNHDGSRQRQGTDLKKDASFGLTHLLFPFLNGTSRCSDAATVGS